MKTIITILALVIPAAAMAQDLTPRQQDLLNQIAVADEQVEQSEAEMKRQAYRERLQQRRYIASRAKAGITARRNAAINAAVAGNIAKANRTTTKMGQAAPSAGNRYAWQVHRGRPLNGWSNNTAQIRVRVSR